MYLVGMDAKMITLSSSKNILKPPPVCKKVDKPGAAASQYPGPLLQAWVRADDLRSPPDPVIIEYVILQKVSTSPLIYSVQFDTAGVTIILTIEFEAKSTRFDIAWTYLNGFVLIDSAVTGMQPVTKRGSFDSRLQAETGNFSRIDFQARITR